MRWLFTKCTGFLCDCLLSVDCSAQLMHMSIPFARTRCLTTTVQRSRRPTRCAADSTSPLAVISRCVEVISCHSAAHCLHLFTVSVTGASQGRHHRATHRFAGGIADPAIGRGPRGALPRFRLPGGDSGGYTGSLLGDTAQAGCAAAERAVFWLGLGGVIFERLRVAFSRLGPCFPPFLPWLCDTFGFCTALCRLRCQRGHKY